MFNDQGRVPDRTVADPLLGRPIGSFATAPAMSPTYTKMHMGYDHHWNFGIQCELATSTVFESDYFGNKRSLLNGSNAFSNPLAGAWAIQRPHPFPRFGSMGYNWQDVSTTYHALQAKVEKRHSGDPWYLALYNFFKSLLRQNTPVAHGDWAWEKSLSRYDIPHYFAFSSSYEVPFGKGRKFLGNANRFVDGLFGEWQLQGILGLRRGRPYTPTVSRDVANNGCGGQRPDRLCFGNLDHPTVQLWFDKSAFKTPRDYTYRNSGGDILREDRFKLVDFSVFKQFAISEQSHVQFHVEFFNLTNTRSFEPPNTNIDTALGGRVRGATNTPRQIQFAVKYNF